MNFKLKFTGKTLKDALWKAARATYIREYEVALVEMNALSTKAHDWCWTTHVGHFKYQVACGPHTQHTMDVEKHSCSCKMWQLTGIPCNHVVSAIFATDRIPDEFVDQCYKTSTQQTIYNHMVQPVRGQNQWTPDETYPYLTSNPETTPDRPKKNKIKEANERDDHSGKVGKKGLKMSCTNCDKVKRLYGGIRNKAAARGNSPNQHPESNQRASTQPPSFNVVRWYKNTGGSSLSQPYQP
ncbi:hypothetical protein GQ457_08G036390 [Hibiscus cannabinus]